MTDTLAQTRKCTSFHFDITKSIVQKRSPNLHKRSLLSYFQALPMYLFVYSTWFHTSGQTARLNKFPSFLASAAFETLHC